MRALGEYHKICFNARMFTEYANFKTPKDFDILREKILQTYELNIVFSKLISWGYHTFTIYMETNTKQKVIARISNNDEEKVALLNRAIIVEQLVEHLLPTPKYIVNIEGKFITNFDSQTLRLHHHIEGTSPFEMNMEVFEQMIDVLNKLHGFSDHAKGLGKLGLPIMEATNHVLLHGDLTPSNIIVSFNKITGVVDFENTMLGPAEYDLAYMALFSWFRFGKTDFTDLTNSIKKHYYNGIELDEYNDFAKQTLSRHLNNIIKHKEDYSNQEFWQNEKDYFEKMNTRLLLELR